MTNCNSCGILISFVENGFKPDGKIKWKVLNAETNLVHKCPNWKPIGYNSNKDTQVKNNSVKCPICKKYTIQGFCFHKL
jgi:predicted Zn-ribbon and HTH transcriptional regulator